MQYQAANLEGAVGVIRFFLPGVPPSVNHAYTRFVDRRGHVHRRLTPEAQKWIEDAHLVAKTACKAAGWQPVEQKVVVRIWIRWPNARRHDPDNTFKLLLDSLSNVVYTDDKWALPRVMDWTVDRTNPGIHVEIELADEHNTKEEKSA